MRGTGTRLLVTATIAVLLVGFLPVPPNALAATATTTALTASSSKGTPLDELGFTATVVPAPAGGTVEWNVDGAPVASTSLAVDGTSAWATRFGPGTHSVTAAFGGDVDFDASASDAVQVVIDLVPTTTSVAAAPNPVDAGSPTMLTASVAPVPSPASGRIEWRIDSEVTATSDVGADGTSVLKQTWADPGTHEVVAVFQEGTTWAGSESDPVTVTVSPVALSVSAVPVEPITLVGMSTLKVSVAPNPHSGSVGVYTGSTAVATGPLNADGTADLSVPVAEGTNTYRVDFIPSGATYVAATTTATIEGRHLRPILTLTANRTSAVSGESLVTFTVAPDQYDGLGTGTTVLSDTFGGATKVLGTAGASTDGNGDFVWVLSVRLTGIGVHQIHAHFTGDASFAASDSGVLAVPVTRDVGVAVSGVGCSYATFYPYKDGYRDTVAIRGTPGERVSVSVRIYSPYGTRVRIWSLATRQTKWTINWNGTNASGHRVSAGKYKVVQVVRDSLGHAATFTSYATVSNKRLYWYSGSISRYADTGSFGWTGDASASYSDETPHAIDLYGGFCSYDDASGQDVCDIAMARYRFTLPTAALYSAIRFSVYGFSWDGMGVGYLGLQNYTTQSLDGVRPIGYTWTWYTTPSALAVAGHVSSSRVVSAYVWVGADPYPPGSIEYEKVKLTYKYALLR